MIAFQTNIADYRLLETNISPFNMKIKLWKLNIWIRTFLSILIACKIYHSLALISVISLKSLANVVEKSKESSFKNISVGEKTRLMFYRKNRSILKKKILKSINQFALQENWWSKQLLLKFYLLTIKIINFRLAISKNF